MGWFFDYEIRVGRRLIIVKYCLGFSVDNVLWCRELSRLRFLVKQNVVFLDFFIQWLKRFQKFEQCVYMIREVISLNLEGVNYFVGSVIVFQSIIFGRIVILRKLIFVVAVGGQGSIVFVVFSSCICLWCLFKFYKVLERRFFVRFVEFLFQSLISREREM